MDTLIENEKTAYQQWLAERERALQRKSVTGMLSRDAAFQRWTKAHEALVQAEVHKTSLLLERLGIEGVP